MGNVRFGLKGQKRLIVKSADGEVTQDTGFFDNLITDAGLDGFYSNNQVGTSFCRRECRVGTGNSTPTVSQLNLDAEIANTDNTSRSNTRFYDPNDQTLSYVRQTTTFNFEQGEAEGNIAEVGVGYRDLTNNGNLFSRALVKDTEGNPTTITVLSDEYLTVVYQLDCYVYTNGATVGSAGGVDYTMHVCAVDELICYPLNRNFALLTTDNNTLFLSADALPSPFSITFNPREENMFETFTGANISTVEYNASGPYILRKLTLDPTVGNFLGAPIKSLASIGMFGGNSGFSQHRTAYPLVVEFNPPLDKDDTKSLEITFRLDWGRHSGTA